MPGRSANDRGRRPRTWLCIGSLSLAGLSFVCASSAQAAEWEILLPMPATVSQALSPDGSLLAVSDTWGPILIFDAGHGTLKESYRLPERRLYSLAWDFDMRSVLVGDPDRNDDTAIRTVTRVFDEPANATSAGHGATSQPKDLPGGVHGTALSPSGRWLATIDYDRLRVTAMKDGRREEWMEPPFETWRLAISDVADLLWQDQDVLVAVRSSHGIGAKEVARYDFARQKTLPAIALPESSVAQTAALSADGQRLLIETDNGTIFDVDLKQGRLLGTIGNPGSTPADAIAMDAQDRIARWRGDRIALSTLDDPRETRCIRVWDVDTGHQGSRPVLAWLGDDLLLAGEARGTDQWRAERLSILTDETANAGSTDCEDNEAKP
ncbi:MAG: hypothetical protein HOP03_10340 [Lysobacter sp.]|nr:hypothetical protein [Lysobacter sp.]